MSDVRTAPVINHSIIDLGFSLVAQFCEQLRQPLCLTLLRNCMSPYDEAFGYATRLLGAVMLQPKLRSGLKAELGAFFPLILLRILEAERCVYGSLLPLGPQDLPQRISALGTLLNGLPAWIP